MIADKHYLCAFIFTLSYYFGLALALDDAAHKTDQALTLSNATPLTNTLLSGKTTKPISKRFLFFKETLEKGFNRRYEACEVPYCADYATALEIIFGTKEFLESDPNNEPLIEGLPPELQSIVGSYLNQLVAKKHLRLDAPAHGLALFDQGNTIAVGCSSNAREKHSSIRVWSLGNNSVKTIITDHEDDLDDRLTSVTRISNTELVINTNKKIYASHGTLNAIPKKTVWSCKTLTSAGTLPCKISQATIDSCSRNPYYGETEYNCITSSHIGNITGCATWGMITEWMPHERQWRHRVKIPRIDITRATVINDETIYNVECCDYGGIEIYNPKNETCAPLFLCKMPCANQNSYQTDYVYPMVQHSCISPAGDIIALVSERYNGPFCMMKFNPKNRVTSYLTAHGWQQLSADIAFYPIREMNNGFLFERKRKEDSRRHNEEATLYPIIPTEDLILIDAWHRITACAVRPETNDLVVTAVAPASSDGHVVIFDNPFTNDVANKTIEAKEKSARQAAAIPAKVVDEEEDEGAEIEAMTEGYPTYHHWRHTMYTQPTMSMRRACTYAALTGAGFVGLYALLARHRQSSRS